jgi:hypothetical protein
MFARTALQSLKSSPSKSFGSSGNLTDNKLSNTFLRFEGRGRRINSITSSAFLLIVYGGWAKMFEYSSEHS